MWIWSSLLPRSSKKDSIEIYLVFFKFYSIFYVFLKFIHISKKLNQKNKIKNGEQCLGRFWLESSQQRHNPRLDPTHMALAAVRGQARAQGGHHAPVGRGNAVPVG
jgi:hypothetical protein